MQTVNEHPEVLAATEKWLGIKKKIADLERDLEEGNTGVLEQRRLARAARVQDVLEGKEPDVTVNKVRPIDEIVRKLSLFREAEQIAKGEILKVRGRVSAELLESTHAWEKYCALVQNVAKALLKLAEATDTEFTFREALEEGGFQFAGTIPPVPVKGLFNLYGPREEDSWLARYFREAIERGYLERGDIPQPWRKYWRIDEY